MSVQCAAKKPRTAGKVLSSATPRMSYLAWNKLQRQTPKGPSLARDADQSPRALAATRMPSDGQMLIMNSMKNQSFENFVNAKTSSGGFESLVG